MGRAHHTHGHLPLSSSFQEREGLDNHGDGVAAGVDMEVRGSGAVGASLTNRSAMGSQQFMVATDLLFLGHLGRSELAVGSLCTTIFNLLWFGVAGFGTGFDTLGSQAQGAADFAAVRQWAFLAAAFLTACCVPAAIVLSCGESIARTILSQDEYTSERVGRFCTLLIVGLFAAAWTLVMQKFLQVRGVVKPVAWTSFATFLLNIALNVLFIRIMNLGLNGSALATTTSRVVNDPRRCVLALFGPVERRG